jgi:uncharacterized membrane protein
VTADEGAIMSEGGLTFNRGAVRPVECIRAGWQLIREEYWLFFAITLVGMLIGNLVPFGLLVGPMMCGIYLCLLRREGGQRIKFEMLFKGFNYFAQSLIATLLMVLPVLVLVGVFYGLFFAGMLAAGISLTGDSQGGAPDATIPVVVLVLYVVAMLILLVVATVVGALFMFTFPLIVDRGLSGPQALWTSVRAVFSNLGGVVGLLLLTTLLSMLGVLACYVGAYLFMPIHMAAIAVAYRRVFPADGSVLIVPPPTGWPEPSALEPRTAPSDFPGGQASPVTATPPPPSEPGIQRSDEAPGPS